MGHGWKIVSKDVIKKEPCLCGKGFIVTYEITQESDYSFDDRVTTERENECKFCNQQNR
jgi:hypothetical protein